MSPPPPGADPPCCAEQQLYWHHPQLLQHTPKPATAGELVGGSSRAAPKRSVWHVMAQHVPRAAKRRVPALLSTCSGRPSGAACLQDVASNQLTGPIPSMDFGEYQYMGVNVAGNNLSGGRVRAPSRHALVDTHCAGCRGGSTCGIYCKGMQQPERCTQCTQGPFQRGRTTLVPSWQSSQATQACAERCVLQRARRMLGRCGTAHAACRRCAAGTAHAGAVTQLDLGPCRCCLACRCLRSPR